MRPQSLRNYRFRTATVATLSFGHRDRIGVRGTSDATAENVRAVHDRVNTHVNSRDKAVTQITAMFAR